MLEKFGQLAEQAATNVSRRQFLGRFGRGAMVVAAAAGGMLALPAISRGGRPVQTCGLQSFFECQGRSTGDACNGDGRCTLIRGTTDCYCRFRGKNHRVSL
jgi:hypothetical protein